MANCTKFQAKNCEILLLDKTQAALILRGAMKKQGGLPPC
jgi:hypothetical protein